MESKQGVRETFSVLREEPEPGLGGDRAEIFIVDYRGARVARMLRAFWRELTPREREAGMTKAYTRRSAKETEALAEGIVLAANSYDALKEKCERYEELYGEIAWIEAHTDCQCNDGSTPDSEPSKCGNCLAREWVKKLEALATPIGRDGGKEI